MVKTEEILRFEENPEKSRKNPKTRWNSGKENYNLIWEVNHPICQEIWLKPLISEDLRSVLKKSL